MMTLVDLNKLYPGYWTEGTGNFALICQSARRITLFQSLELAMEAKFMNCCRNCKRYETPHLGYKLEPAERKPKPKISRSWRLMVEAE